MTIPGATSYQVRAELEDLLERDLLGPMDGPEEELPPGTSPAAPYLLGRLVPRERVDEPEDDEPESDPDLVDREVGRSLIRVTKKTMTPESEATVRSGRWQPQPSGWPSASLRTSAGWAAVASWGRYERKASEVHETEQGRARVTWHRVPSGVRWRSPWKVEGSDYLVPDPSIKKGVTVHYTVRHRGERRVVELRLVNGQRPVGGGVARTWRGSTRSG